MKLRRTRIITLGFMVVFSTVAAPAIHADSMQKDVNMTSSQDFLSFVTQGDVAKVKELLKQDTSLARVTDKDGVSAVLKAVYYNRKDVLDVLLATREDLDIFEASATGKPQRVADLIKKDDSLVNAFAADGFRANRKVCFGHLDLTPDCCEPALGGT